MAKLLPPATTLYFPHAPLVFSSPMPQKTTLTNAINLLSLYQASGTTYYVVTNATVTAAVIILKTPGDYRLSFDWRSINSTSPIQIKLNSNIIFQAYGSETVDHGSSTVYMYKVPANSKLEIVMVGPYADYTGIRNVALQSSVLANVLLASQAQLSTYNISLSSATSSSQSYDADKPMPPPVRSTANYPIRLKDTFVY